MPSKFQYQQEYCFPCKYHHSTLVRSGNPAIYDRTCCHPQYASEKGRDIGNTEDRPTWCPIRGNKKAEEEAERDE